MVNTSEKGSLDTSKLANATKAAVEVSGSDPHQRKKVLEGLISLTKPTTEKPTNSSPPTAEKPTTVPSTAGNPETPPARVPLSSPQVASPPETKRIPFPDGNPAKPAEGSKVITQRELARREEQSPQPKPRQPESISPQEIMIPDKLRTAFNKLTSDASKESFTNEDQHAFYQLDSLVNNALERFSTPPKFKPQELDALNLPFEVKFGQRFSQDVVAEYIKEQLAVIKDAVFERTLPNGRLNRAQMKNAKAAFSRIETLILLANRRP